MRTKVAILGGSFDPIHKGHTQLAKNLVDKYQLKTIYFIPNTQNPLKGKTVASASDRLKMLELALKEENNSHFKILDWEIKQNKPCYTFDTVTRFIQEFNEKPYLIIGNEVYKDFDKWYRGEELLKLVELIRIDRTQISSTKIREKLSKNEPLPELHSGVMMHIKKNKLYSVKEG
jgi:nicotinate-nucleotide adenylyltransferase